LFWESIPVVCSGFLKMQLTGQLGEVDECRAEKTLAAGTKCTSVKKRDTASTMMKRVLHRLCPRLILFTGQSSTLNSDKSNRFDKPFRYENLDRQENQYENLDRQENQSRETRPMHNRSYIPAIVKKSSGDKRCRL
jgi:hypothetical protein